MEDKIMEKDEIEKYRDKKILNHQGRIRELSDSMKHNDIRTTGVPEEERQRGPKVCLNKSLLRNSPMRGRGHTLKCRRRRKLPSDKIRINFL